MRNIWVMLIAILSFNIELAEAGVSVSSLTRNDSLRTHLAMPFRAMDSGGKAVQVLQVTIKEATGSCSALVDPHISSNFFVKCLKPTSMQLLISASVEGKVFNLQYSGIPVIELDSEGEVVAPVDQPSALYIEGRKWFNYTVSGKGESCATCHNPSSKADRTAAEISASVINKPGRMGESYFSKNGGLTPAQANAIAEYLKTVNQNKWGP